MVQRADCLVMDLWRARQVGAKGSQELLRSLSTLMEHARRSKVVPVDCWGGNLDGELGDGSYEESPSPIRVTGITNATRVASGDVYACSADTDMEC